MAKEITSEQFENEVLKSELPVLVDFWAPWCSGCKMIARIIEDISTEKADKVKVVKINYDEAKEIGEKYEVQSLPTLILFKNGKDYNRLVGAKPKGVIEELIGE